MPRTKLAALTQDQTIKNQSHAEAKAAAKEIFITMPIARIATVADRVGVSKYYVEKWAKEENWLVARAEQGKQLDQQLNQLLKQVGDPKESAASMLEVCNQIVNWTKGHVDYLNSKEHTGKWAVAEQLLSCALILNRVAEIQKKLYQRLGINC